MSKGNSSRLADLGHIASKQLENAVHATSLERAAFGLGEVVGKPVEDKGEAYVVLKYFDADHECFSDWEKGELKEFSGFLGKLRQQRWESMSDGMKPKIVDMKKAKAGAKDRLKRIHDGLSKDIQFMELRITQRARVHGFRLKNAFFLVLLDREHRIFPER